jgi:hypothetical protein
VIAVVEGSITFGIPSYRLGFVLGRGERLDLPAHLDHNATAGPSGVTCLEAHLPAGTLGKAARDRSGRW